MDMDRWHELLTNRYVCEACTTRLYSAYPVCPACHQAGCIRPLYGFLREYARDEEEYRALILAGQAPAHIRRPPVELDYLAD